MRKERRNSCCVYDNSNNNTSIIIDLALDHSDYYTRAGSAWLVGFYLIAGFSDHRLLDPFFSHRDQEAECFWQRSQDAARRFNIESVKSRSKRFIHILTILLNVFIGRLNVSEILRAGAFFGLLLGVCTAQHLMNIPIKMRNKIPMSTQRYQFSITYCLRVCSVSLFSSRFFNRTNGPSASTARHFKNTSQYPWKLSHGAPNKEQ